MEFIENQIKHYLEMLELNKNCFNGYLNINSKYAKNQLIILENERRIYNNIVIMLKSIKKRLKYEKIT